MKKYLFFIVFIFLLTSLYFLYYSLYWSYQIKKDIQFIHEVLKNNHPGFYNNDDEEFRKNLFEQYDLAINSNYLMSSYDDYQKFLENYAQSFNDTHLRIEMYGKDAIVQSEKIISAQEIAPQILWITLPTFLPNVHEQEELTFLIAQASAWQDMKAVIFDVRGNRGGNSSWGTKLVKSLFSQSYANCMINQYNKNVSVRWRASQENLAYIKTLISSFSKQFGIDSNEYKMVQQLYEGMQNSYDKNEIYYIQKTLYHACDKKILNSVRAKIIVIIDEGCSSSCLKFIDDLKAMQYPILLVGKTTKADSIYLDIRTVILPSQQGALSFPIKAFYNRPRGHNQPYCPDIEYQDDLSDTSMLQEWILNYLQCHQ